MISTGAFVVIGIGVVVFAATNIDDIFLLSVFFADAHLKTRAVVIGQFAGIAVLVAVSAGAALAAVAVPEGWIALLGMVPLSLGLHKLWLLLRGPVDDADAAGVQDRERNLEERTHSQMLSVMGVTVANGGDNLGVYIPLFAGDLSLIPIYALTFLVMTALWCAVGYGLVNNSVAGRHLRGYGHLALPFVLIALGLYILSDAVVLLR